MKEYDTHEEAMLERLADHAWHKLIDCGFLTTLAPDALAEICYDHAEAMVLERRERKAVASAE